MIDDDDDFEERFEEFCNMSEAEVEAVLEREMAAYNQWWDSLTPLQQYRRSRHTALKGCLVWRKSHEQFGEGLSGFFMEQLRSRQIRLVKLRIWRSTGAYPGSA